MSNDDDDYGGMKILALIAFVALGAVVWFAWQMYAYHDCLRVGHTKAYCVLDFGNH